MNTGTTKSFTIVVLVTVMAFICCLAQAEIITNEPIEVINPRQIGIKWLDAERIPIGEPDFYKPNVALLDDGELLLTVMGPFKNVFPNRPHGKHKYHMDALLYRSKDGGRTWIESGLLPPGKESHLTVLKDGIIMSNAHLLQKLKLNPVHYCHSVVSRSEDF